MQMKRNQSKEPRDLLNILSLKIRIYWIKNHTWCREMVKSFWNCFKIAFASEEKVKKRYRSILLS